MRLPDLDPAQSPDLDGQVRFFDRRSRPDSSENLVFGDQLALPLDQQSEEIGRQPLAGMRPVFSEKAALGPIEPEAFEPESPRRSGHIHALRLPCMWTRPTLRRAA
jgi:hypothetical protein